MKKMIYHNAVRVPLTNILREGRRRRFFKRDPSLLDPISLGTEVNPVLGEALGVSNVVQKDRGEAPDAARGVVIGSIRMGYGHYRMAIAMASAVKYFGKIPYWLDLSSFKNSEGGRMIRYLEGLYSLGSRLSQRSEVFNRFFYEPFSAHGFKKLSANLKDQASAALYVPILRGLPLDIPFVATHAWPAQGALEAGIRRVVNAVPDNWPLGLHLAEGALHTVQSPSAYFGYRTLKGMGGKKVLNPMPKDEIFEVGHYVDHELLVNLESDTRKRLDRLLHRQPLRLLISIGGAGAQEDFVSGILAYLTGPLTRGDVVVFLNVGSHLKVWDEFIKKSPRLADFSQLHFGDWDEVIRFTDGGGSGEGLHVFFNADPFAAVYTTNRLMPVSDLLITKPSELSYYPIPKLLIKRVGHHEAYGAIRSAELGDGTLECEDLPHALQMLELILVEEDLLTLMNRHILEARKAGIYDGAYRAVALALGKTDWVGV